jgi:RES domain-containing protein
VTRPETVAARLLRSRARALAPCVLRLWRVARGNNGWEVSEKAGRWSHASDRIIYASSAGALSVLEALAHLEPADAQRAHRVWLIETRIAAGHACSIEPADLPPRWKDRKSLTREIGRQWLASGRGVALLVPSALAPGEMNALINPAHPAWPRWVARTRHAAFRFDRRLTGGAQ